MITVTKFDDAICYEVPYLGGTLTQYIERFGGGCVLTLSFVAGDYIKTETTVFQQTTPQRSA